MPSYPYDELDNEEAWRDERGAPAIMVLSSKLKAHYNTTNVWVRGNNSHMNGYHRSRRWILTSKYCTNRTYSVTETSGNRSGGDSNWACALDLALPHNELVAACKRLDAACRAGRLEKITQWFGNLGGDSQVDGWNNITNKPASSDSSHLTHLHISFDRGRANEDHTDLFQILTGEDEDVDQEDVRAVWQYYLAPAGYNMQDHLLNAENSAMASRDAAKATKENTDALKLQVTALTAMVEKILAAVSAGDGNIDTAAILAGVQKKLDAAVAEIKTETVDAVADLGEGGSAKVRTD